MNTELKAVIISITGGALIILGGLLINHFVYDNEPKTETNIKWIEEKYSVIEELEKCKTWGGSFDGSFYRDTANIYWMRYLKMKCTKENWKGNVTETETLFDYKFLLEDIRNIPIVNE